MLPCVLVSLISCPESGLKSEVWSVANIKSNLKFKPDKLKPPCCLLFTKGIILYSVKHKI